MVKLIIMEDFKCLFLQVFKYRICSLPCMFGKKFCLNFLMSQMISYQRKSSHSYSCFFILTGIRHESKQHSLPDSRMINSPLCISYVSHHEPTSQRRTRMHSSHKHTTNNSDKRYEGKGESAVKMCISVLSFQV